MSFGAQQTISTNLSSTNLSFDIVNTSTGAAIAYFSTTGVTVAKIDTTGAVTSSANRADASATGPISISTTPTNNNIWVYWTDSTFTLTVLTALNIVYAIYDTSLSVVLGKTTVLAASAPFYISNMIAVSSSATGQTLYYGVYAQNPYLSPAPNSVDSCGFVTTTSTGTIGTPATFAQGVLPYSRSFTVGSNKYAVFLYRGANLFADGLVNSAQTQPTFFVISLSSGLTVPLVVARFGSGLVNSQNILNDVISYTPAVCTISSNKFLFSCGLETQEFNSDYYLNIDFFPGGLTGVFSYAIDFNSVNAYRATNTGQLAVLNGGVTQIYDGQTCTEFGFHLYPEILSLIQSTSVTPAGEIANGIYSYIAIFQWTDANGNLHQSAPSLATPITTTGANNAVSILVSTAFLSQKVGVSVALFRTQASGTVYFQVTDPVFVPNVQPSVSFVLFLDYFSDAHIAGNPQAYTYPASSVLENSTPPPSMAMLAHNNRLWFVDSENQSTIWYTKSFSLGNGLSPSAFMTQQIDPKFGNITALAEMDEKLVTFKQNGIFVQSGDGVNDTGSGSTLSFPQIVPSVVGCDALKSVILIPNGVMFHTPNGIYLIDRSLSVSYIGAEVQSYNSQVITSANVVPGKSQIRFLCSSGLTLVYDYIFSQWSTFTNHTGLSATNFNSLYVYATTAGAIFQESIGTYLDNATGYSVLAQTSWLALASVQGFQRVKRLILLGDFTNGASSNHKIQIQAAYDFSTSFGTAFPYTFGAAAATGVFQYRERLPQQKCDVISLLIQETNTADSAEYIDISNISFEAGVKKGLNKLGATKSVG